MWVKKSILIGLCSLGFALAGCCLINRPPTARFSWNPPSPTAGSPVTFTDNSFDPDGQITTWFWSFGDGATASSPTVTHTYTSPGSYTVSLTVTDNCGATSTRTETITVQRDQGGGGGGPSCPPLEVRVWLDQTTFQIGTEVVVHMYFNQPVLATLTVRIIATGQTRTVFANQFFSAGAHDFRAIVGQPEGERIMTLIAVNSCGETATSTFAYRAWGPAPPIIGPG